MLVAFPEYVDPFTEESARMETLKPVDKHLEQVIRTPGREPSPQPLHFSVNSPKRYGDFQERWGHRVLRSVTNGYANPEFKGKIAQMGRGNYS
jgi:glutamate dehydrogenase